jgi:predicted O-methyltransferase YrrM
LNNCKLTTNKEWYETRHDGNQGMKLESARPNSLARHRPSRWLANLTKFPVRTQRSLLRLLNGDYSWEKRIDAALDGWLDRQRYDELNQIEGTSSLRECRLLASLAAQAPPGGCILEIGAWKGKSTAWLVEGARQHQPLLEVVSVDPHLRGTWDAFNDTIKLMKLHERGLTVLREFSQQVGRTWGRPLSLLWVDGCHDFDAVQSDIRYFVPHVLPGAWIVFDDAAGGVFPGVEKAIAEEMPRFTNIRHRKTLRHLQLFQVNHK